MKPGALPVRILLLEDDLDVAAGLAAFLEPRGVSVDFAYSLGEARALAESSRFDVLVLDVHLPDGDGVELCRELKSRGLRSPVLFLTARSTLDDKLRGFDAGGVDYMCKPFAPSELLARLRALARNIPAAGGVSIRVGEYSLEPETGLFSGATGSISLHATGSTLLRRLMQASPGSVSRDELNELLWGAEQPASDPLRMHVYELRQSLRATFGEPLIETVRGFGYRFGSGRAKP